MLVDVLQDLGQCALHLVGEEARHLDQAGHGGDGDLGRLVLVEDGRQIDGGAVLHVEHVAVLEVGTKLRLGLTGQRSQADAAGTERRPFALDQSKHLERAVVDEAREPLALGQRSGADALLLLFDDRGAELGDEHAEAHGEEDHDE